MKSTARLRDSPAKQSRGKDVAVAGSVGPLGISADEAARGIDRALCFSEQVIGLLDGGAEWIFFETFMDCDETEIALRVKNEVGDAPAICSFACSPEGRLSTGMPIVEAFAKLRTAGAKILGVNCMNGPHGMVQLLERVPAEYLLAAYPNAGYIMKGVLSITRRRITLRSRPAKWSRKGRD